MLLLLLTEPVPLEEDADGVVRVKGTRVTLDTVVAAFAEGATAEEIAQQYPTLALADIYTILSYYLHRRKEVDAYLQEQDERRLQVRRENESRFDPKGVRERLMGRRGI